MGNICLQCSGDGIEPPHACPERFDEPVTAGSRKRQPRLLTLPAARSHHSNREVEPMNSPVTTPIPSASSCGQTKQPKSALRLIIPQTRPGKVCLLAVSLGLFVFVWLAESFGQAWQLVAVLGLVFYLPIRVATVYVSEGIEALRCRWSGTPAEASDIQTAPSAVVVSAPQDAMELYLNVAGVNVGPYSHGEIRSRLSTGRISANDYVWMEGWMGWRKIADLAEFQSAAAASSQTSVNQPVPCLASSPAQPGAASASQPATDTAALEELRDYCAECQSPIQFPKCLAGTQAACTACGTGMRLLAPLQASQLGAAVLVLSPFLIVFPRTVLVAGFCLACIAVALAVLNPQVKLEILDLTPSNILARLPLLGKLLALTIRSFFKSLGSPLGTSHGPWTTLLNSPVIAGGKPQRGLVAGSVLAVLLVALYFIVPALLSQWKRTNEASEQRKAEELRRIQAAKEANDPVMAERTAEAWRQIQAIEVRVRNSTDPQSRLLLLSQLDLNHVDPLLVAYVAKIAELSKGSSQLLTSLQADMRARQASQAQVGEALGAVGAIIGMLGSGNARNLDEFGRNMSVGRQVGELAGQVGNAIEGVQADKQLAAKYQGPLQYYQTAFLQMAQYRTELGNHFSEKYRRPFLSFQ